MSSRWQRIFSRCGSSHIIPIRSLLGEVRKSNTPPFLLILKWKQSCITDDRPKSFIADAFCKHYSNKQSFCSAGLVLLSRGSAHVSLNKSWRIHTGCITQKKVRFPMWDQNLHVSNGRTPIYSCLGTHYIYSCIKLIPYYAFIQNSCILFKMEKTIFFQPDIASVINNTECSIRPENND